MYTKLSETKKINNKYCGKGKEHDKSESLWETFYGRGLIDTGILK